MSFNADEVFAIAEDIERNAFGFYRKAASLTKDANAKALFLELAKWEVSHLELFSEMRNDIKADAEFVFDPDNEAGMYLKAIADGHAFEHSKDPEKVVSGTESAEDVIRYALKMEKDSIVFYIGLQEMITAKSGKDKVTQIIREEMRHVAFLSKELAVLK